MPIFHQKMRLRWVPNAEKKQTNNAYPTPRVLNVYYIPLARVGSTRVRVGSTWLFRSQHVGILNTKWSRWRSKPMRGPNASGFVLHWNIGYRSKEGVMFLLIHILYSYK